MKNKAKVPIITQILLLSLLALSVWAINLYFHPDSPSGSDAAFYASTARNIVEGKGFLTPATSPTLLSYSIPAFPSGWPSFLPPFHPLVIAGFFLIFGISDLTLAFTNGFFFIITIPLLYLLAKKIINRQVAFLTCLWYIFTPSLQSYSGWGIAEPLFIFLIILGFFVLFTLKNRFLWVGVIIGLSYLTKFQGILLLIPLLIYVYKIQNTRFPFFLFLGGFALVLLLKRPFLPPFAPDYTKFNNHFFWATIAQGAIFSSDQVGRILTPVISNLVFSNLNLIFGKLLSNLYYFWQNIFNLATPSVTVLFFLSFFRPNSNKQIKHFKILTVVLLLVFLSFHLLTFFDFRYLHPLVPFMLIFASDTFLSFLKKESPKRVAFLAGIFTFLFIVIPCFTSPFWGSSILWSLKKPRKPTPDVLLGKIIRENTSPESIIVSESPHIVSWYGERRAIRYPLTLADLAKIDKEMVPVDALFLSRRKFQTQDEPIWEELIDNPRDFGNFRFAKKFEISAEENYYQIPVQAVLYLKKPPEKPK